MYTVYSVFALASMAAAETALRELGLHPSSQVVSVGQIIAIVVAVATVLRAAYLFWKLFHVEPNKFVWPFSLGVARKVAVGTRRRTYMLLPPPPPAGAGGRPIPATKGLLISNAEDHRTSNAIGQEVSGIEGIPSVTLAFRRDQTAAGEAHPDLTQQQQGRSFPIQAVGCTVRIGNVIKTSREVYEPLHEISLVNEADALISTFSSSFDIPDQVGSDGTVTRVSFLADECQVISYTPTDRKLAECTEDVMVRQALKQGPVYMITGLIIARGLDVITSEIKERALGLQMRLHILPSFYVYANTSSRQERSVISRYEGDVILAYRLHPIRRRWMGGRSGVVLGPPFESKDAVL
jgi:hypothetical protein